jgi:hypothetical protein
VAQLVTHQGGQSGVMADGLCVPPVDLVDGHASSKGCVFDVGAV